MTFSFHRIALVPAALIALTAAGNSAENEWPSWGGDPGGSRYSTLKQITTTNVGALKPAWTYHTGEVATGAISTQRHRIAAFEATPLDVNGILYFSTPSSRVIALDADTGREIWSFDPQTGAAERKFDASRGVAYWQDASGADQRILYGTLDARLIALDARTGKLRSDFGDHGTVLLRPGAADKFPEAHYEMTSPPAVWRDLVICGSAVPEYPSRGPSGMVRAFDVRSGKLVWTFHTVPQPGEEGYTTWAADASRDRTGVNVWSIMSVDAARGMIFLPIGSASYDFYGADRKGLDLYSNCLVALDAATGKPIWHFQVVHHDVWDYDPPAQPVLVSVRRNGRQIPAVVQLTKMGLVFVLDRLTGKPLFPVVERAVPQSGVPGEATWPTQPFPLLPPPLSRMSLSRAGLSDVTPDSARYCRDLFDKLSNHGMFTPYGEQLTLVMPGTLGGATWSGGSFDPSSGLMYVNTNELGAVGMLQPQPDGSPERYRRTGPQGEYMRFLDEQGWPCQKPPWGKLNAINLNDGSIAWQRALGRVPELAQKGIPETGTPNIGGSIVTAGGLVFIAATTDQRFRAFDARSGKELWSAHLPASGHATPMTCRAPKTGRQLVIIAAGGGGFFDGPVSDAVIAFALGN